MIGIAETEGSTNHKFNLVIDSFNAGIGKVKFGSSNNRWEITLDLFPEISEFWDPASLRPCHPFYQQYAYFIRISLQSKPEIFFQKISAVQFGIRSCQKWKLCLLILCEIFRIFQKRILRPFQTVCFFLYRISFFTFRRTPAWTFFLRTFSLAVCLRPCLSANLIERFGCPWNNMKRINTPFCIRILNSFFCT